MPEWKLPTDLVNDSQGLMEGTANWAYEVTSGTFWAALLAGFCIVLFMVSYRFGQERAFGYASIAGVLGSMILVTLNLMSWWIASIFIIVGGIGITYMALNR